MCAATHGLQIKRHDNVMEMLAGKLRSIGYVTKSELQLPLNNSLVRPVANKESG